MNTLPEQDTTEQSYFRKSPKLIPLGPKNNPVMDANRWPAKKVRRILARVVGVHSELSDKRDFSNHDDK
jgi:hypothetical protein